MNDRAFLCLLKNRHTNKDIKKIKMRISHTLSRLLCAFILVFSSTVTHAEHTPGAFVDTFTRGVSFGSPYDAEFGPDGHLWVVCELVIPGDAPSEIQSVIARFDGSSGDFIDVFAVNPRSVTKGEFNAGELRNIAFDSEAFDSKGLTGNVYISGTLAGSNPIDDTVLWRIEIDSETPDNRPLVPVFGASELNGESPVDITFEPGSKNLYIALQRSASVLKYDTESGDLSTFIMAEDQFGPLTNPRGLVWGPDGNVYIADELFGIVRYKVDTKIIDGQTITNVVLDKNYAATGVTPNRSPTHLVFGPDRNLYVSRNHPSERRVVRYYGPESGVDEAGNDLDGIEFTEDYVPSRTGGFTLIPNGIDFGPDGRFYVASGNRTTGEILRHEGPFPDQDGDSIDDSNDNCPGTEFHDLVDLNGCSDAQLGDDDGDGVLNYLDLCPGTVLAPNESVDGNGCSSTQLADDDSDDVANFLDLCPGTTFGETVDQNGCSNSQLDDDNDGYNNSIDQCPGTASGATIIRDGCSIAQLDNDQDKVENGLDSCPATALNASVDGLGCSDAQVDSDGDKFCDVNAPSTGPSACVETDNCPIVFNPDQQDTDGDGEGDACEPPVDEVVPGVLNLIDDLLQDPNLTNKGEDKLEKAQEKLEKALDKLQDEGVEKALKEISNATDELLDAGKKGVAVEGLINLLVETSRLEAQKAIDAAIAANGDQKDIDKAIKELDKAQKDLTKGDPDKAIEHYKDVFDEVEKALK